MAFRSENGKPLPGDKEGLISAKEGISSFQIALYTFKIEMVGCIPQRAFSIDAEVGNGLDERLNLVQELERQTACHADPEIREAFGNGDEKSHHVGDRQGNAMAGAHIDEHARNVILVRLQA